MFAKAYFNLVKNVSAVGSMSKNNTGKRTNFIWTALLGIGFPVAILLPFIDTYAIKQVPLSTEVPFDYTNSLLSIASILFGFSSLIIISKEWVDRKVWAVLIPPLVLIVLSGVTLSNLALGYANSVQCVSF